MYSRPVRVSLPLIASFILLALGMFLLSRPAVHAEPTYNCATATGLPQTECEALVALYNATDGSNWINNTDWLTTTTPCSWYGVTCVGGYVTELNLRYNSLVGVVPPEIGNLTNLRILRLDKNQLTAVPPEIGNLATLMWWLDLGDNQLTAVPPEIGNLTALEWLDLDNNQLMGVPPEIWNMTNLRQLGLRDSQLMVVPPEIGNLTNLTGLYLDNNQLTSVQPEIWNLTNLTFLSLDDNQLTVVPPEIGNLTNLTHLYLDDTQLTTVPPEIGNLTNLTTLRLGHNQLTAVPSEIGNLTNLRHFDLWKNQLTTVPPEIGNLTSLEYLRLWDNRLTALPSEIGNLTSLGWLDLGPNQLTAVPPEIGNLTNLTYLDLNRNQLTAVPPEIGNLTNLTTLRLGSNQLTDVPSGIWNFTNLTDLRLWGNQLTAVPSEIGNLTSLTNLSLSSNQLTTVPMEIGNLTSLTSLSLSDNQLTTVPMEIGNLTSLTSLYLGSNQLTTIPTEIGNLTNLTRLNLDRNQITSLPPEINNLVNLTSLALSYNQLTTLPSEIENFVNLTYFGIAYNPLSGAMPVELTNLTNLSSFYFLSTSWCTPDTPVFDDWLASISNVQGTGLVCEQPSGAVSGAVSGAGSTPLSAAQAMLYQDIGSSSSYWLLMDTVPIDNNGQYLFTGLGQGITYSVRFEDGAGSYAPEYYDNVGTIDTATPITATLGVTRTGINAVLGLPQPPTVDVDTASGSVNVNPLDGTVAVNMTQGNPSDITVTRTVTCTGGATPSLVELQLEMSTETITYTMSSIGADQYRATIPQADITADAMLNIKSTCGGVDDTTTVGTVNLYDPSGNITNLFTHQPIVFATVTLYQVPNWRPRTSPSDTAVNTCESNNSKAVGAPWSQAAPTNEGVIVNTDFTTVAPLLSHQQTDIDGHYGWDVPEGCWYVVVRADGYETLTSPVVGIPPEVTDLHLALTPTGAHKIYLPMITR